MTPEERRDFYPSGVDISTGMVFTRGMTKTETTPTEAMFDIADAVTDIVNADEGRTYSPSELFRRAAVKKAAGRMGFLYATLSWMVEHDYIATDGNGCWTRYRARRFGEYHR